MKFTASLPHASRRIGDRERALKRSQTAREVYERRLRHELEDAAQARIGTGDGAGELAAELEVEPVLSGAGPLHDVDGRLRERSEYRLRLRTVPLRDSGDSTGSKDREEDDQRDDEPTRPHLEHRVPPFTIRTGKVTAGPMDAHRPWPPTVGTPPMRLKATQIFGARQDVPGGSRCQTDGRTTRKETTMTHRLLRLFGLVGMLGL